MSAERLKFSICAVALSHLWNSLLSNLAHYLSIGLAFNKQDTKCSLVSCRGVGRCNPGCFQSHSHKEREEVYLKNVELLFQLFCNYSVHLSNTEHVFHSH